MTTTTKLKNEGRAMHVINETGAAWGIMEFSFINLNDSPVDEKSQAIYTDGDLADVLSDQTGIFFQEIQTKLEAEGLMLEPYGQGIYLVVEV